eukprot:scaffold1384_cov116-Cylindrotheca_fusiformis.AAC.15
MPGPFNQKDNFVFGLGATCWMNDDVAASDNLHCTSHPLTQPPPARLFSIRAVYASCRTRLIL